MPFDLSQVMFLATANNREGIPAPLYDRMEVIEVPGYTRAEKLGIAKEFLVPKQRSAHGLTDERLGFTDEGASAIIDHYTREAGVRNLERQIAAVCRATAVKVAEGEDVRGRERPSTSKSRPRAPHKYRPERPPSAARPRRRVGLAWTPRAARSCSSRRTACPARATWCSPAT
jgi:ATP-dependent Lon protease